MRPGCLVLLMTGVLIGCRPKPTPKATIELSRDRMEMIVDSVYHEDTDSLHQLAVSYQDDKYWTVFDVDSLLSVDTVFERMNGKEESYSFFERINKHSLPAKRSSEVSHYITTRDYFDGKDHYSQNNTGAINNCRAYLKNDTLEIRIGTENGFSGHGFSIYQCGAKYLSMPYYFDDIIDERETEPLNIPLWQKLVLDKATYSIGDSLYGYISFGSVFFNEYGNPSGNKANGFFRAVVKKRDW